MAKFEVIMPKLGESIIEATITKWMKNPGETIEEDDPIVEIATDKVDSEIPSPVEGKLVKVLYNEGDVVAVGKIIAIIETDPEAAATDVSTETVEVAEKIAQQVEEVTGSVSAAIVTETVESNSDRFYSPLVKNIAKTEGISQAELDKVSGTGKDGRVTKDDLMAYLKNRGTTSAPSPVAQAAPVVPATAVSSAPATKPAAPQVFAGNGDEIVEMDRMRRLIADHMVMSVQTSPHVTSYIEVDVTNMVKWRDRVKDEFFKREKKKSPLLPSLLKLLHRHLKHSPA